MDYLTRQADLITESARQAKISIIGCGGIGSHLALSLARMGYHNLTLYDDDVVSIHNVSSQGFNMNDVGKKKVAVVRDNIVSAVRKVIRTRQVRINRHNASTLDGSIIVILAVDSMVARKEIVEGMKWNANNAMIINPAMGAEYLTVDVYNNNHRENLAEFNKAWFSDDDAVQEQCTAKATIYTTLLSAGFISKIVKDYTNGLPYVRNMAYDIKNNSPILMFESTGKNLLE